MSVVTRFAPSPTGYLHIGGARTALFNWLFARHHGGEYLLRIEDTDRARSTQDAIDKIIAGLGWLGLDADRPPTFQSHNAGRHIEVAQQLLDNGHAYRCYCSPDELTEMREAARAAGRTRLYDRTWRDRDPADAPFGVDPVIRVKMPTEGETVITDAIQGEVRVQNDNLDDFILLRADGTPTYMLAVVVDDDDMGITHVIRGDDHLNNAFRQYHLFAACGWDIPVFAHMPLLHGADGAKLSKRHGALGVEAYEEMGFLPEAICNYLLRLGWSHGDDEIIPREQAIEWFDLDGVGRAAARFDMAKLESLNGHYIAEADDARLTALVEAHWRETGETPTDAVVRERLLAGMGGLKLRAKTIPELAENALIYARPMPLEYSDKAARLLDEDALARLDGLADAFAKIADWSEQGVENAVRDYANTHDLKLGALAQPLRAALTGGTVSPSIFEVAAVFGRDETLGRIRGAGTAADQARNN
ncbi:MAG: glutamate--tRNA ligase [Alphaproteobacteria bacterium]